MVLLGCLSGCERDRPPEPSVPSQTIASTPTATPSAPAPPASAPSGAPPEAVVYDCGSLGNDENAGCEPPVEFVRELHELGNAMLVPDHHGPDEEVCKRAKSALELALTAGVAELPTNTRIVLHNAALRIFSEAGRCQGPVESSAARLVQQTRFEPSELPPHDPSLEVDRWLGPRTTWSERRKENLPLFHDEVERGTRAFRPVRTSKVAAIFSQLVVVDTRWAPRVTPLIGRVEIRRGLDPDAPACVVKLQVDRIECPSGHLTPVEDIDDLPVNHFFNKVDANTVGCNGCHHTNIRTAGDPVFGDLEPLERQQVRRRLALRRAAVLKISEKLVARVRRALE